MELFLRWLGRRLAPEPLSTVIDPVELSRSPDGFVREAAVRQMGLLQQGRAVEPLIERLNDWVPQVRNAARESLQRLATPALARDFIQALPSLDRLERQRRTDHRATVDAVRRFLLSDPCLQDVSVEARYGAGRASRAAALLLLSPSFERADDAAPCFLSHRDPIVRANAFRRIARMDPVPVEVLVDVVVSDPSAALRCDAFRLLSVKSPPHALRVAELLIFDRTDSLRGLALRALKANGVDAAPRFVEILSDPRSTSSSRRIAISSLATLRFEPATELARPLLVDHAGSVRRAALEALVRFGDPMAPDAVMALLGDVDRKVSRTALRLLPVVNPARLHGWLMRLVSTARHQSGIEACAIAAKRLGKWESLEVLLTMASRRREGAPVDIETKALHWWCDRSNNRFIPLADAKRPALEELVQRAAPVLGSSVTDRVRLSLP